MKGKKISIVTPVYNCSKFIEKCILSIKVQTYTNYEHIIVDGGSTDGTLDIIKKYEGTYPMKWISEKDNGMYDAICKGFSMATGDIFAWLNADDTYFPWTFSIISNVMQDDVQWCTGINTFQNENNDLIAVERIRYYNQKWIKKGYYGTIFGFIQQESTFWTRELWQKANGKEIENYKLAGDWKLWTNFAKYEPIYSVSTILASFRRRCEQLSGDLNKYFSEIYKSVKRPLKVKRILIRVLNYIYLSKRPISVFLKNPKISKKIKRVDFYKLEANNKC